MSQFNEMVLILWLPMIVYIAIWIYFVRRGGGSRQRNFMDESSLYLKEYLEETRRTNTHLSRIASALEKKEG